MQFFQELYSHIHKNSGKKFENMFLAKIASKGTSLTLSGIPLSDLEGRNPSELNNSRFLHSISIKL